MERKALRGCCPVIRPGFKAPLRPKGGRGVEPMLREATACRLASATAPKTCRAGPEAWRAKKQVTTPGAFTRKPQVRQVACTTSTDGFTLGAMPREPLPALRQAGPAHPSAHARRSPVAPAIGRVMSPSHVRPDGGTILGYSPRIQRDRFRAGGYTGGRGAFRHPRPPDQCNHHHPHRLRPLQYRLRLPIIGRSKTGRIFHMPKIF